MIASVAFFLVWTSVCTSLYLKLKSWRPNEAIRGDAGVTPFQAGDAVSPTSHRQVLCMMSATLAVPCSSCRGNCPVN
jgi:hypothetical protein